MVVNKGSITNKLSVSIQISVKSFTGLTYLQGNVKKVNQNVSGTQFVMESFNLTNSHHS